MEVFGFYEEAIRALAPKGNWCLYNNSLEGMEWRTPKVKQPSIETIEAKAQELYQAYIDNPPVPSESLYVAGVPIGVSVE